MKDLKYDVNIKFVDELIELCSEKYIEVEQYAGGLNDLYIIHNDRVLTISQNSGRKPKGRKYILIIPYYENEWSNRLVALCTDDCKKVEKIRNEWKEWIEELED